ncbi:HET-domain-containing protein [Annulohypoxylon bovei var. microspora]|nr:HET-domain-containing protein [Annulohypoxylon bovei var. microspora]
MARIQKASLVDPNWTYLSTSSNTQWNVSQYCPRQPYISLTLPSFGFSAPTLLVHRLQITTVSHDQGRSDDPNNQGTYEGSHTNFDVEVKEPTGRVRIRHQAIVNNIRACLKPRKHVVSWSLDQEPLDPVKGYNAGPGPGSNGNWLSLIQASDTVQIVPMAQYPGWINFALEAHLEIWFGIIDTNSPENRLPRSSDVKQLYHQLDVSRKETRLVIIEPSADPENDTLELSLEYVFLDNDDYIPYEALSYCWGNNNEQRPILLKGLEPNVPTTQTHISRDLFIALKALRNEHTARIFWIDQLCINQSDLEERAEQVALMGDIYANAKRVCVWLGELDDKTKDDFCAIKSIFNVYSRAKVVQNNGPNHIGNDGTMTAGNSTDPYISHAAIHAPTGYELHNDSVFHRKWFERVWVLQEVWNVPKNHSTSESSERVVVICGNAELPWAAILQAGRCIRSRNGSHYNTLIPAIWMTLFRDPKSLDGSTQDFTIFIPESRLDILSVVINALEMGATDPRDKIFALLTFGEETHHVSELPDLVKPDYNKSVRRVYADFTRWWIYHYRSLGILSAVHALTGRTWLDGSKYSAIGIGDARRSSIPSWSFWSDGRSEWRRSILGIGDHGKYNASGDTRVDIQLLQSTMPSQPYVLALKGIRVGLISSITYYPFYRRPLISEAMHQVYAEIFDPASTIGTWGHGKAQTHLPVLDHGQLPYHYFTHWRDVPRDSLDHSSGQIDPNAPDYLPCYGKCMFLTEAGMGLCPNGSRVGDILVILYGSKVPHLLRPSGDPREYYFVGECYVDGIMRGEALKGKDTLREETFLLV